MKANAVIYVIAAVVIAALLVANWGPLSAVTTLNLLVVQAEMPLAVLLLLCLGIVALMDLAVHALGAHGWRVERRKLVSELDSARGRAEREEESRLQALRTLSEREFVAIREQLDRVIAGQAALLRGESPGEIVETPPGGTIGEPELVPPRTSGRRRH